MRRPAAVILIISLFMAVPAIAGQFEDALEAYNRGDYKTTYRLIKPLAEQGVAGAQHNLGVMYSNGQGVPQDYSEAVKWYRRAAEQGLASAQHNLGRMYLQGEGVPHDYAEVLKWFRKAVEQGYASAQSDLGVMYLNGEGVPQDYVMAHMWFNLATSRFSATEQERRKVAESNRDLAASKMTPAQIAEAQKLAREWKPKTER